MTGAEKDMLYGSSERLAKRPSLRMDYRRRRCNVSRTAAEPGEKRIDRTRAHKVERTGKRRIDFRPRQRTTRLFDARQGRQRLVSAG